jgi:polyphosphate kinase
MSEESGIERTSRARAARSSTARVSVEPGVGSASAPQVRRHRGLSEPALDSPERFFNRELSWLDFNFRVMEESANPGHPLLERLRFLSISASNLDEFFMVRYAGLREQMAQGLNRPAQDGLNPAEQVDRVRTVSKQLMAEQEGRWRELRRELRTAGIELVSPDELDAADRLAIHGHFERELFPITTPMSVDPAHPFPFIPNLGFAIAYALEGDEDHPGKRLTGLVPLPSQIARFVRLPEDDPARVRYLPVEDIFTLFVSELFPGFVARGACQFRVIRDSDIEIEEEAEDLIREFESLLKERRRGRIVRVKINNRGEPWLRDMIVRELEADPGDVVDAGDLLGLAQLSQLITDERRDLQFTPYEPRFPERVRQFGGDIFACVRHKDMVVHHPYESFDVVVQFLRQAARDPAVVAIKQTLYRTSRNSPIVAALIEAAEAGKNVTALVEIKARFDEEANLRLARDLEHAGA